MRIHSNGLNPLTLDLAMQHANAHAPDVMLTIVGTYGSRSHKRSFEVALRGHGAQHKRNPANTSLVPGSKAATYDDWGWFLAAVFNLDPKAKAGPYRNQDHFNTTTNYAYVE